jgi:Spy/CpxP family protein refolding chaperone
MKYGVSGRKHRVGLLVKGMNGGISITKILRYSQELQLTDEQIKSLQSLLSDYVRATIKHQADIRITQLDLSDILREENPDFEKARSLAKNISDLTLQIELSVLDSYKQGLLLLSGEQKGKLSLMMSPAMQYGMNLPFSDDISEEEE